MYFVSKRMEIAGCHKLDLPYESKCANVHGHNWIVTVHVKGKRLTDYGMLMDFTHIKSKIQEPLDHHCINDVIKENPTAENMARWILHKVNESCPNNAWCYKVEVQESEGNIAVYVEENGDESM